MSMLAHSEAIGYQGIATLLLAPGKTFHALHHEVFLEITACHFSGSFENHITCFAPLIPSRSLSVETA